MGSRVTAAFSRGQRRPSRMFQGSIEDEMCLEGSGDKLSGGEREIGESGGV